MKKKCYTVWQGVILKPGLYLRITRSPSAIPRLPESKSSEMGLRIYMFIKHCKRLSCSQMGSSGSWHLRLMQSPPSVINSITTLGCDNKTKGQDGLWFGSSSSINVNEEKECQCSLVAYNFPADNKYLYILLGIHVSPHPTTFFFWGGGYLFIYLFIYGCVGSSFLCEGFL